MTSWLAASEQATVDAKAPTRHERIPHQLPAQLSVEGLGLRVVGGPPATPAKRARGRGIRGRVAAFGQVQAARASLVNGRRAAVRQATVPVPACPRGHPRAPVGSDPGDGRRPDRARARQARVRFPMRSWDSRDQRFSHTYDALRRPVDRTVCVNGGPETLLDRLVYGELLNDPTATNHRGRVYRAYDGAGVATTTVFDFRGHALGEERQLVTSKTTQPDWSPLLGQTTIPAMATAAAPLLDASGS